MSQRKILACERINYDHRTDRIEPLGYMRDNFVRSQLNSAPYRILTECKGWGGYTHVIDSDHDELTLSGTYLVKLGPGTA